MAVHSLTLNHQTRIAIQVVIEDDTGVLIFSILVVTRLLALLYRISRFVVSVLNEGLLLANDVRAALSFTNKVLAISLNALAYGLGVTL